MKIFILITMFASLIFIENAYSDVALQIVIDSDYEFQKNQIPTISGTVLDVNNQPINDALLKITTSKVILWTTSDGEGEFKIKKGLPADLGIHPINILALKEGYVDGASSVIYAVVRSEVSSKESNSNSQIQSDLTAQKILEQAEILQKQIAQQEQKRRELEQQQKYIQEQRVIAYKELEKDLQRLNLDTISAAPRNAFAAFISHIDESVQGIFLAQFEFTEKITDEAHIAKLKAIGKGKSSQDAMKIFQKKAATSKSQLVRYNNDLNVQYGFAEREIQDQFDEFGKLPRTQED